MQIKVTGRGLDITPALRDYAQAKVSKFEEFFKNIQKVEVVLEARSIDNVDRRQVAEIRIWLAGLKTIQAQEGGRDMYSAIDQAAQEAKRQIERYKEKKINAPRRQAKRNKIIARKKTPGLSFDLKSGL